MPSFYPWIKKLVRVNKSFIVQRALTMRQMLESSARMSRYMHYTIMEKKQSIWIAQREGRAKDSNDRTQDSVLKMLAMGGEGDTIDRLMEINIAPIAISYEYDPCDFLKAQEFQLKMYFPFITKQPSLHISQIILRCFLISLNISLQLKLLSLQKITGIILIRLTG